MKLKILDFLYKQQGPQTLSEILHALDLSMDKQRSLRRWLNEMIKDGLIKRLGHKRDASYQAYRETEQLNITEADHSIFAKQSQSSIDYVHQPIYLRAPKTYNKTWFDSYVPNQTYYLNETLRKTMHLQGRQDRELDPAVTFLKKIYHRLLIDLSYNSSRLEGNTYSLLDTEKLVLEGIVPEGKLNEEKIMILNHKEAIRYLVENNTKLQIKEKDIFTLHYLLSDSLILPEYAGKVRISSVRISASTYVTLEGKQQLEEQLLLICNKVAQINDPFEQSFFLLVHLAYLQAFIDVNKRTARLCANIPLIKANLVPLSFNDINKEDYIAAMIAIYELNDVKPLADLYYFSYLRTCQEYLMTVEAVNFDEIRARYRQQRRELIRYIIVNRIVGKILEDTIEEQTKQYVKAADQAHFIKNVKEDLQEINAVRIVGLGVTEKELNAWLALRENAK